MELRIFERISQMEPMLPTLDRAELDSLALQLIRESAALRAHLHPETRQTVANSLRNMNSYYSNLIEGHHTHPIDIEKALSQDFAANSEQRAYQMESAAHVTVEALMERKLAEAAERDSLDIFQIFDADFLSWLHQEFYLLLPEEFRIVKNPDTGASEQVIPGELRRHSVRVGNHIPPVPTALPEFLGRFQAAYAGLRNDIDRVIAMAAAHHRLAWIHPFLDGNGRVTRLHTRAFLILTGTDSHGLWSPSRGLARRRAEYYARLAEADQARKGDLDGCGNLSDAGLGNFCRFFLTTCLDQVRFMSGLLELDGFQQRIEAYVNRLVSMRKLSKESFYLIRDVFLRGSVGRGEAARITGLSERGARNVVRRLLDVRLLASDSPRGTLKLGLPMHAMGYYFPRLYPEGVEFDFEASL